MWTDNSFVDSRGIRIQTSVYKPDKEYSKGGRTKYNITVFSDPRMKEIIFRVRCPEVELKEKSLKSNNLEDAKKEALILVNKKIKDKIEYLSSLSNIFEAELKKES